MKILSSLLFSVIIFLSSISLAELQVFPLRVALSDKDRKAQISLRHKGDKAMKYRITAVFYKMGPDGSMTLVESTSDNDKDGRRYFRYSPRQVTLEPNVEQVLRLISRPPADLPDGEYRAHLHFEGMSDDDDQNIESQNTNGAKMILKARMAVAIPVIIKKGETQTKVALNNFKISKNKDQKLEFSIDMSQEGNGFAYGNILVRSMDTSKKVVGVVNGVSSYIQKRTIKFPLSTDSLSSGRYELLFLDPQSSNGEQVLARSEVSYAP